jgi:hypothetical protein
MVGGVLCAFAKDSCLFVEEDGVIGFGDEEDAN